MFELFFKYPVSVFQKGHFVLLAPWPLWLMAVFILAAAGLLFWHVRRNHGMLSGARPIAIWLLETALAALILFLLWHPALSVAVLKPQQNVVAVLVDNSRSMGIADSSGGAREAAAKALLDGGILQSLADRFQVRMYEFGKEASRIQKPGEIAAQAPATHIGDALEQLLAESSSIPLGAVVLLSDGADNSGGIGLDTISAIRRQRIPIHTIGFGREHPDRDVEITDVVVRARALPKSKLTAEVTLQSYGFKGSKARLSVKENGKALASKEIQLQSDGALQGESLVFDGGDAGAKTVDIGVDPLPGEENTRNNQVARLVNVENRKPRILYIEGEPRWEYKFIRRALDDYGDIELASMVRTTPNGIYRQLPPSMGEHDLEDGFPSKAEDLFAFQGLIVGTVEAAYFTPTQQALIHDFVDRRGGGLLFLGGRASLSDGGYQSSPLADLIPVVLPASKGTFHRDFSDVQLTAAGAQSILCRLDDDPVRNADRWKKMPKVADYQEVGDLKPGATALLNVIPPNGRPSPLFVTENYGHGRTALSATGGTWRWKMWMDHADKTHASFWQQIFRYLVTDSPGQVSGTTPQSVLSDDSRVQVRVLVRDKEFKPVNNAQAQVRFMGPAGTSATLQLTPKPLEEGVYVGEWTAEKPGSYVAEVLAGRDQETLGADMFTFRREDGVAEDFHTSQNRELLEKLAQETGGRYYTPSEASKLGNEISYSEAGITTRETRDLWNLPVIFLLALAIRACEWLLRRRWGVV
ncbi:MAG: hypothetical protein ABSC23_15560 [Bryobacteraceae bacterium]|jgi:uncharacterized membrane protein